MTDAPKVGLTAEQIAGIKALAARGGRVDDAEIIALCDAALRSVARSAIAASEPVAIDWPAERGGLLADAENMAGTIIKQGVNTPTERAAVADVIREMSRQLAAEYGYGKVASPPPAPEGCVLVPMEPTEAMLVAARDWSSARYGKPIGNEAAYCCWKAMLAAAAPAEGAKK